MTKRHVTVVVPSESPTTGEQKTVEVNVPLDVLRVAQEIQAGVTKKEDFVVRLTGYTQEQLTAAFELVENSNDWKAPVDSYCTTAEVKIVAAAIEFFTSTTAHFDYIGILTPDRVAKGGRFEAGDHIMKVRADGYRRGPAGDH